MAQFNVGRRDFLRGASAATALTYSRVLGANDCINLGVIGCGDRGRCFPESHCWLSFRWTGWFREVTSGFRVWQEPSRRNYQETFL